MIRLGIVVEGDTEERFVRQILDAHLRMHNIETQTFVLHGNVSAQRLARTMANLFRRCGMATSLVDYYGFRDKGMDGVTALEGRISTAVQSELGSSADSSLVIPYIQQYEFEALLFSEVSAFQSVLGLYQGTVQQLAAVRQSFSTPEEINDHPDTAPSKRITNIIRHYDKVTHGSLVAQAIGLTTIRRECPRFDAWVTRLESLSA